MGRTWRKDSDYGSKKNHRDEQRQLKKKSEKIKKQQTKTGDKNPDVDLWITIQRNRM
jgi:hypothetical protein